MQHQQQDDISLLAFTKDFERYSWRGFSQDAIAGLTVAMLTVPQAMAYALVAGLPLSCGLFSAIFAACLTAIFGSSRHLITGPTNAIAILIQSGLAQILFTYYRDVTGPAREVLSLQILTQLTLVVGAIQILAALFKLGRLTHFVSHSVIVGYMFGVAAALVINQLFPLLGMDLPADVSSLYERGAYVVSHLHFINWPTALIGIGSILLLIFIKRLDRRLPAGAVMLAVVAIIAYVGSLIDTSESFSFLTTSTLYMFFDTVPVVGNAGEGNLIPSWQLPFFQVGIMNGLLPVAFAISLIGVMEASSTAKSLAARSGQRLSTNQEIFGLGVGNFLGAFIGAMPLSGSPSRSTLAYENGARTRISAVFNSFFVVVILLAFGFLVRHIPIATFAALLVMIAGNIVNIRQLILCFKATRSDSFVLVTTILSCMFFSLDIAFYIGVILSITLYLKKAAIPQLVEFTVDEAGVLHSAEMNPTLEPRKIRLIKVEGELFFGAADLFQSTLKSITEDDTTTRVIILQLKNARDIDATACLAIQQLFMFLKNSGRYLIGCGLTHQVWDVLSDAGLIELIGKNNLFIFDERHPQISVQKAFSRAHDLLQQAEGPKPAVEGIVPTAEPAATPAQTNQALPAIPSP